MAISFTRTDARLLFVHSLAIPCFVLGAQQLQLMRWVPLLEAYQTGGMTAVQARHPADFGATVTALQWGPLYALTAALVGACVLSGVVTWRRRASGLIPVLLWGVVVATTRTDYYKSPPVHNALAFLRGLLAPVCLWKAQLGAVGGALVLLGLLPFLLTWNGPSNSRNSSPLSSAD